ncbi:11beta-hydroxysteroid dehydrogenase-like [Mucor ambiguus]|uniref:11beta-hydroxysteroid dehydrogenase-like n=1 Tax=Mucor ambiguus TaxID=91626 RepID=A0A0C9M4V7_9FUNG|nr:11beta-hydroxysteroid dehydrogenase-like [Mucor ambiguus]
MQKELIALAASILVGHYILKQKKDRKRILKPQGERVVILGCSSGIGKECALSYAARGAKLVLFARRKELLEQLKQQCQDAGSPQVDLLAGDVTVEDDLVELAAFTKRVMGDVVDTVIYCAGMISVRPFLDACGIKISKREATDQHPQYKITEQQKDGHEIIDALHTITTINYFSSVWTARLFLPLLLNSVSPNLIVVSSMAGKVGAPTRGLYAGSKHALHGFFDSIRVELSPYNVHIGLICPGTVDTELRQSAVDKSLGGSNDTHIAGSKKNKLSPCAVAKRIVEASDMREREVYIPAWFGHVALWAKLLASPLVDYAAARKYKN